eukprot:PhM_4_TR614/c0_g1_i1/m.82852
MYSITSEACKERVGMRDGVWSVIALSDHEILVGDAYGDITRMEVKATPPALHRRGHTAQHTLAVSRLRTNEKRTTAISLGFDCVLCVWRLPSMELLTRHQADVLEVFDVDIHPTEDVIICASNYARVLKFLASNSTPSSLGEPTHHTTLTSSSADAVSMVTASAVRFSASGENVIVGHSDGSIAVLASSTMEMLRCVRFSAAGPTNPVCDLHALRDGTVFTRQVDGSVSVVSASGEQVTPLLSGASCMVFDAFRGVLWVSTKKASVQAISADGSESKSIRLTVTPPEDTTYHAMCLSACGKLLLCVGDRPSHLISVAAIHGEI